jgi:hypothetical protein
MEFYKKVEGADPEKIKKEIETAIAPFKNGDPMALIPLLLKNFSFL